MNASKKHRKHMVDELGRTMGYMIWTRRNNTGYYKRGFPNTSTRKYFLIRQVSGYRLTEEYRTKEERRCMI